MDLALKDYRAEMERQMRHMEQTLSSIHAIELMPEDESSLHRLRD